MPDLVVNNTEDIFRIIKELNLPPQLGALIVQQHEEIVSLQNYCNELGRIVNGMIDALKMSQALHKANKAELEKLNKRYEDPYQGLVKPEQTN